QLGPPPVSVFPPPLANAGRSSVKAATAAAPKRVIAARRVLLVSKIVLPFLNRIVGLLSRLDRHTGQPPPGLLPQPRLPLGQRLPEHLEQRDARSYYLDLPRCSPRQSSPHRSRTSRRTPRLDYPFPLRHRHPTPRQQAPAKCCMCPHTRRSRYQV